MPLRKRLSRMGTDSYGVVMTKDIMGQLGTSVEEAKSETGVHVMVTMYGNTLIVRREGARPLTPAEVAYFLTNDIEFAKHFPASPLLPEDDGERPGVEGFLKPGYDLKLTRMMRYALTLFKSFGPLAKDELTERFGVETRIATRIVSTGYEEAWLVRQDDKYALNPDIFDV